MDMMKKGLPVKYALNGKVRAVQMHADGNGITPNAEVGPKWFKAALERGHISPYHAVQRIFGADQEEYGYYVCTKNNRNQKPNSSYDDTALDGDWIICDANDGLHCMRDNAFRSMFEVKGETS